MSKFNIRVEFPAGNFMDSVMHSRDYLDARIKFEKMFPEFKEPKWYGMVCFVNGAQKAEDM